MAMTSTQQLEAYRFFAVAFDAAPGVTYMSQLAEAYASGMTTEQIVEVYTTKAEFLSIYPSFYTNSQFATKLVDRVVDSSASATAKAEAVADIEAALAAGWSQGKVIYTIFQNLASKDPTDATWGATATLMANQVAVAKYYTEEQLGSSTSLSSLQSVISAVTATSDVSSSASITSLITAGVSPTTSQSLSLTSGADVIVGGSGDDTITGAIGTLTSSDEISGGAGNDTLTVKIDNLTANNTAYAPVISGVETITLEARNASATFSMTNVSGATTVNVKGITDFGLSNLSNSGSITVTDGYSANLTLALATNTATAQAFTVNLNDASGTDIIIAADSSTTAQDVLTLNAVTNWGHGTSLSFSGMEKLAVNGDGNVSLNFVSANAGAEATGYADLTAIDASGLSGALTVSIDSKDINLVGGAGADTITMTADLSTNDTINGGAGSDVLNAALTGGYVRPIISNVETLNIDDTATAVTADFRDVSGVTTLNLLQTTGVVFDKLQTSVATIQINSGDSTANALTFQFGTAAVASDVTLNLGNAIQGNQQTAAATASGMGIGVLTLSGNSGSLTVKTVGTAKYTAAALELKDFGTVTLNAASANLVVDSAVDIYTAQTLSLIAGAGKSLTVGENLSGDSVRTFTVEGGQSATVTLAGATDINGSAGTVTMSIGASGLINASGLTLCGAETVSLTVGASALFTADVLTLGQAGATAGSGALALRTFNLSGAGDVSIASVVGNTGATAIDLTFNINPTSTAADIGISGIDFTEVASAATASEQSVTYNISGLGNVTLSAAATTTSNVTYHVNATALASGSNLVISLANIDDTDSVASAVFGAASGSYVGVDGVDNIELGLGAMSVNGGLGNDVITLNNTATHRVEFFATASGNLAGYDTIIGAASGDVIFFVGGGTATAKYSGGNAPSTGTATTGADFRTTSFSAQATADSTAIDQLAIYTANGDTIVELLTQATATGATIVSAVDYVRVTLSNKDFTAITAAFQLNTTGSGLSITLL